MPVCRVDGYKIIIVEKKIVKASIKAWVNDAKAVLNRALLDGMSNTDDNTNNSSTMSVNHVSNATDLVVNG